MRASVLFIFTLLFTIAGLSQDRNYGDCVVKESSSWGTVCQQCEYYKEGFKRSYEETFAVTFKNVCSESVELKVAMQEKNGTWRTFPVKKLDRDQSFKAFACKGSGKYLYWVRRFDDPELILPSDRDIISEYREY